MKQNHFIQGKCQPLLQAEYTKYESEQQSCPCSTSYSPTLLVSKCQRPSVPRALLVSRPRPSRSLIWTSNPFFISDASTQAIFIVIALHDIFQVLHIISEQFTESVNITAKKSPRFLRWRYTHYIALTRPPCPSEFLQLFLEDQITQQVILEPWAILREAVKNVLADFVR